MNRFFALLSIVFVQALCAQTYQLSWPGPASVLDTNFKPVKLLRVDGGAWDETLTPFFEHEFQGNITQAVVQAIRTENLTSEEAALVKTMLSAGFETRLSYGYKNKRYITKVRILPLRRGAMGIEKLIQYSLSLTFENDPPAPSRTLISTRRGSSMRTAGFTNNSVLSSGLWYKISVSDYGVYKLDYAFFQSMGIDPSSIDPRTIKLYGNGGGMLPQQNSATRLDDLTENAVLFVGEADGVFNTGDYLLFYGQGPHTWAYNSSTQLFQHTKNLYSEKTCYFVTYGGTNGLRISDVANGSGASHTLTRFDDRDFLEEDLYSVINSGREWYGDRFESGSLSRTYNFSFPNLTASSDIKVTSSVLNRTSSGVNNFSIKVNSVSLATQSLTNITTGTYDQKGQASVNTYTLNSASIGNSSSLAINYTFSNSSSLGLAHLNYVLVNAERELKLNGNFTAFRSKRDRDFTDTEFIIDNASASCRIWNVTTPYAAKNQLFDFSGSSASFTASSDSIEEYIVFVGSTFSNPTYEGRVENQNLHAITAPNIPDMVIVCPPAFRTQAERLANFKKNFNNLDVYVATTQEIYNEFSSGVQDITAIRDFMKMLYDRKAGNDSLRYLLLFGDASFDYKDRIPNNTNFVPCYQATQSLRPLESYPSDDYYGFLDNNEGRWRESPTENHLLDIGTGRLLVKSEGEATAVVDKIIHYSQSTSNLGKWRNRVLFVADDGDNNTHQVDAEDLANKVDTAYVRYSSSKIYLDASVQIITPGGEKSPDARAKLDREVEKGALVVNYTGHGGESGWAQEGLLEWNQIETWDNYNALPFMITATCEFGSYDNPAKPSGAEVALLRSDGGAIGLITSSRVVYQVYNKVLNTQIFNNILKQYSNGAYPSLGDIIRNSKNVNISGVYNRNYILLGDPSLVLNYPKHNVVLTSINETPVSGGNDTIRALSVVKLQGEIRDNSNSLLTGYAGVIYVSVFDKMVKLSTYGTQSSPMIYNSRTNYIFEGKASIENGLWSISFVVPKDISYEFDFGRISLYAQPASGLADANGIYSKIVIGGTDPNAPVDNAPPGISLYMNDESFVNGGMVNTSALFIAKLNDDNGLNVAGTGIGHEMTGELDNTQEVIVMNEFYSANVNDYKNGSVRYPLKSLSPGNHSIKFKAWDTHNNSAESVLEFVVAENEKSAIQHVLNYPNPFSTYTEFHFDHNKSGQELDVMVQIFTISGKLIKTLQTKDLTSGSHFNGLTWDGRDDFGDKIGKGVYVYKVTIRSPSDGSMAHKFEKLVLLN